jgi:hypothetical protein
MLPRSSRGFVSLGLTLLLFLSLGPNVRAGPIWATGNFVTYAQESLARRTLTDPAAQFRAGHFWRLMEVVLKSASVAIPLSR